MFAVVVRGGHQAIDLIFEVNELSNGSDVRRNDAPLQQKLRFKKISTGLEQR